MIHRIIYLYLILAISIVNQTFGQQGIISSEILIQNDSIALPGTLTYNTNIATQPLVIFVHGSGPVNRDGNSSGIVNAAYIKQLSDSLTKRDIGFYRYDKRSATPKNLTHILKDVRFEGFVKDLNLVIDHFKDDKNFSSITLIGHSQGSLVSMLVDQTNIDKFISLAGPSHSIDHTFIAQIRSQSGDSIANLFTTHFKELSAKGSIAKVDPNLMGIFNKPMQPFWKSWMDYNPSEEIKKIEIPILILNGDKDSQIHVEDANNLHEANPKSKLIIIKNMNHALKHVENDIDNKESYNTPNFPLSQELITTIEAFVKK